MTLLIFMSRSHNLMIIFLLPIEAFFSLLFDLIKSESAYRKIVRAVPIVFHYSSSLWSASSAAIYFSRSQCPSFFEFIITSFFLSWLFEVFYGNIIYHYYYCDDDGGGRDRDDDDGGRVNPLHDVHDHLDDLPFFWMGSICYSKNFRNLH